MNAKPNALIFGGSSGLGLELGIQLSKHYQVIVTGRRDPQNEHVSFREFDVPWDIAVARTYFEVLLQRLPRVQLLIYAAGYYQEGSISQLSDAEILEMVNVGIVVPAMLLRRILGTQGELSGFIAITSTSQWTPRNYEPVYTAAKAGLGMLANSLALDERVGKVLVAGPAGMQTRFWEGTGRDTSTMLDPKWVAEQILDAYEGDFQYKFIRILRDPSRVEQVEAR